MNVLCDRHQADLLYSLQLLFEDRLGLDLYVPVGLEWWEQEYWRFGQVFGDDRLAQQYLAIDARYQEAAGGGYVTYDTAHPERPIRCVTLEQARELGDWAFVTATVQENQHGLHRFAGEVGARYVYQVGNTAQQVDWSLQPLALVTSEVPIEGAGVRYHQEFDSAGDYAFSAYESHAETPGERLEQAAAEGVLHAPGMSGTCAGRVASFVNCFNSTVCWPLFLEYRSALPELEFRVHGIDGEDGNLHPCSAIAAAMRACAFGWHSKPQGDGFGHVIHGWAAVGRPLIGTASFYAGRLAEPLWEDGVTCVDVGQRSVEENVRLIREILADRDRHAEMCRAIRTRFDVLVDYDREEQEIRQLLGLASAE